MFLLHVSEDYDWKRIDKDGEARGKHLLLVRFPGLADFLLEAMPESIGAWWWWTMEKAQPHSMMRFPNLPGPATYHLAFTWKAETGLMHFYVNGIPTHEPQLTMPPWESTAQADHYFISAQNRVYMPDGTNHMENRTDSPYHVSQVTVLGRSLESFEVMARCPAEILGRNNELALGYNRDARPLDLDPKNLELLYENPFSEESDLSGWAKEGPVRLRFEDGWMLRDTDPEAAVNHQVLWCPETFPESFVAEWEMQVLSENGLCIVFFCAQGLKGEDVLDSSLPKRDGSFHLYTHGALRNYHISFYSDTPSEPGRLTSNLRKNPGGHMLTFGPIGIGGEDNEPHRIRLIKQGPHIQMQCDGRVITEHLDAPSVETGGAVYGEGQIGFRQMRWTKARYRDFKVWGIR